MPKKIISLFFLFCLFWVTFSDSDPLCAQKNSKKDERLSVLLITIDTLRSDRLSCYKSKYLKTPNIDSLAQKGILFSMAFAHTTTTLPSHANILLGVTPLYHGVHDNSNFIVREEFLTLAEHLKKHGYTTGAFVGAYPLDSRFGLSQGFDVYDDNYERPHSRRVISLEREAEQVVESALSWLKNQNTPWFLWIHCYDPHDPYEPPEPFRTQYAESPYDGEVAYVDFALGKLLSYLKEKKLFGQTLIVLTGDHGEGLGEHGEMTHGFFAYNSTLWTPLIMVIPGLGKSQIDKPVSHIDIFPTVCDLLQIEKPSSLQGASLLRALGGDKLPKRSFYFESLYPYYSRGWAPIRGWHDGKEKFIDSPLPELYDLSQDFDELKNLAKAKKLDIQRKKLAQILKNQSFGGASRAEQKPDQESLEKLRSLGYVSGSQVSKKESFGPEDDVKTLLPYNNKAVEAMDLGQKGKIQEGIRLLKEVISEIKTLDNAYSNLAILYERQGKLGEALEVLKQGMANIPWSYELFSNTVAFLTNTGQPDEVIKIFSEKRFPQIETDPELLNLLGVAYGHKQNFSKAIEIYEKAISLDPKFPALYNNLGTECLTLSLKTKDSKIFQKSIQNFKKAIELDPQYPLPYNGLAMAYRQAGNLDGAIYCWEKALELKPDFGPVYYYLGLAFMEKKEYEKALGFLRIYKEKFNSSLSLIDKQNLDSLIKTCESLLTNKD